MVLIEGVAFPLDVKNNNGWGIPSTEADNAIKSLLSSVVRICPRDAPHLCDVQEDPLREIGHIVEAWREDNVIKTRADITDSIAAQKINDHTWGNGWSVYAQSSGLEDGWATGIKTKSLTLVDNPAWEDSTWTIAASDSETPTLRFFQPFILSAGIPMTDPIPTPQTGGGIPADFEGIIATQKAQIDELTNVKTGLETDLATIKTELETQKTVAASRLPIEDVKKLVETEAQTIAASEISKYKEELAKGVALEKLTAARAKVGLETDVKDFVTLTASDVGKLTEDFEKIKLTASQTPQYPANSGSRSSGFTVGRPKSDGTWEV